MLLSPSKCLARERACTLAYSRYAVAMPPLAPEQIMRVEALETIEVQQDAVGVLFVALGIYQRVATAAERCATTVVFADDRRLDPMQPKLLERVPRAGFVRRTSDAFVPQIFAEDERTASGLADEPGVAILTYAVKRRGTNDGTLAPFYQPDTPYQGILILAGFVVPVVFVF